MAGIELGRPGEPQSLERKVLSEQERRVKNLLLQSFRFSQGSPLLQIAILEWLKAKGYFDNIDIPAEPPTSIKEIKITKKHTPIEGRRLGELVKVWHLLYSSMNEKKTLPAEELLDPILIYMIDRDRVYQDRERPYSQISGQLTPNFSHDPHTSFIRRHIIHAHPTGNDAFDELHRELAPLITRYRTAVPEAKIPAQAELISLAKEWENNHPGHTFFPAENKK